MIHGGLHSVTTFVDRIQRLFSWHGVFGGHLLAMQAQMHGDSGPWFAFLSAAGARNLALLSTDRRHVQTDLFVIVGIEI